MKGLDAAFWGAFGRLHWLECWVGFHYGVISSWEPFFNGLDVGKIFVFWYFCSPWRLFQIIDHSLWSLDAVVFLTPRDIGFQSPPKPSSLTPSPEIHAWAMTHMFAPCPNISSSRSDTHRYDCTYYHFFSRWLFSSWRVFGGSAIYWKIFFDGIVAWVDPIRESFVRGSWGFI